MENSRLLSQCQIKCFCFISSGYRSNDVRSIRSFPFARKYRLYSPQTSVIRSFPSECSRHFTDISAHYSRTTKTIHSFQSQMKAIKISLSITSNNSTARWPTLRLSIFEASQGENNIWLRLNSTLISPRCSVLSIMHKSI